MYFGNSRLFLGIGVLFLPLGLLITAVQYLIFRIGGLAPLVDAAGESNGIVAMLALLLGVLFTVVGLAVVQTTTSVAMAELDAGREVRAIAAYRLALPRLPRVLAALVCAAVLIALAFVTALGVFLAVWLIVRWSLIAQVAAMEDVTGRSVFRRSARLIRGNWWRAGSLILFVSVLGLILGPLTGSLLLFVTSASFDLINLVSSLIYAIVLPFVAIATTYL